MLSRLLSRKFWFGISGLIFYVAGATDATTVTTEQEVVGGVIAVASIVMIGLEDMVKRWRGN